MRVRDAALVIAALSVPASAHGQRALPAPQVAPSPLSPAAGFEMARLRDGIEVGIWYPAQGETREMRLGPYLQRVAPGAPPMAGRYPLVVISHGSGGDFAEHLDTAQALAEAGFVVASLTHPGDNWRDQSGATDIAARPVALSELIGYMLNEWHGAGRIDPRRVGAFGFSSGAFTVLAAAGGIPDLSKVAGHCAEHPAFYVCRLVRQHNPGSPGAWTPTSDVRIGAIVVAAPALGFAFADGGLAEVRIPVQLWHAADDEIAPEPFYAHAVKAALPLAPEFHAIPGAGHYDFIAPCTDPQLVPLICASADTFDRAAFHRRFNAEIVRFFRINLDA